MRLHSTRAKLKPCSANPSALRWSGLSAPSGALRPSLLALSLRNQVIVAGSHQGSPCGMWPAGPLKMPRSPSKAACFQAPFEPFCQVASGKPIDSRGLLDSTGVASLDGKVENAVELMKRLGQSDRVRQSFIRHAFRYWMGRNEMLSDSATLIAADEAYVKSGGSFQAMLVSLLSSDSFIFRKGRAKQ